jgi:hypothetical protein
MRLPLPQFNNRSPQPDRIAEVIETATTEFLAQCVEPEDLKLAVMPTFGSIVKAADEESGNQVMAVVYHATTAPIDSVHRARALGMSLDELREEQPQIFAMLKTEFRAAIIGFIEPTGQMYQYLPPRPPQIHQSVHRCTLDEIVQFSEQLEFLRSLLQVQGAPVEALTAATIREIHHLREYDRPWLVAAGRMVSLILKDDYDRLRYILSQIRG